MSPDSGMALAIGFVAIILPAVMALTGLGVGIWALRSGHPWIAALAFAEMLGVGVVWFFAFGIEYVPRYEASRLVFPDDYEGAALLVACPDQGIPEGDTITFGPSGIARQQRGPRYDMTPTTWRATRASGAAVNVSTVGGDSGPDSPCEYQHLHVGDGPYNHSTDRYPDLMNEAETTGTPFNKVHAAHEMK